jgi:tripartite-type tricarboxylate transporter receptor subunit TctC
VVSGVVVVMAMAWSTPAVSQQKYPSKPIELTVSYVAGGGVDLSARLMASFMNKKWQVPVNVVNKPGGNHVPGLLEVYKAAPNGYSVIQDSLGSSGMLPIAVKSLPFNVMERTFIGIFSEAPMVLSVPPGSTIKNLKDLEAEVKKDPTVFTWTSIGGASPQDYTMRKFFRLIGVDVFKTKPIMSQGAAQAVTLTAGGNVKVGVASVAASLAAIKSGTIRPLAVTAKVRTTSLPDVPTTTEAGFASIYITDRYGPSGPPKLSADVIEAWNKALKEMLEDQEAVGKMKSIGLMPLYLDSNETRAYVGKTIEEVKELYGQK